MPSHVWGRDPQEAFEEPYEYEVQEQFCREAERLFSCIYRILNTESHRYILDDRSQGKAVWLLAMDALDSLRECLKSLTRKEHRLAGKLFRDIVESMDLAAYFHFAKKESDLQKWYKDEIVPNSVYRNYVKKSQGEDTAEKLAKHYGSLSRFTHRTYRVILDGYIKGKKGSLIHDGTVELWITSNGSENVLVLPQTLACYHAVLANLTLDFTNVLIELGLASSKEIREAFAASFEAEVVPRRFLPRRWLAKRLGHTGHIKKVQGIEDTSN